MACALRMHPESSAYHCKEGEGAKRVSVPPFRHYLTGERKKCLSAESDVASAESPSRSSPTALGRFSGYQTVLLKIKINYKFYILDNPSTGTKIPGQRKA